MSKSPVRKDKTCLNCNYVVENRFCPNCGQENTDTRKTFHHLFVHFFEDLTHYENAFWKTIKNLLLKPASLTKEYLSGKRLSYLAPVRLYIFISFVTFLIVAIWPKKDDVEQNMRQVQKMEKEGALNAGQADTLRTIIKSNTTESITKKEEKESNFLGFGYNNIQELDSVRRAEPGEMPDFLYNINKRIINVNEKYTQKEIKEKFVEGLGHNFPKALFVYMPLFAFILWLFHGKKRWYYFDHGIFTLHYFSFLLLIFLIQFLVAKFKDAFDGNFIIATATGIIEFVLFLWMFYYFFPAHHRFYGETRWISFLKSIAMFFINMVLMFVVILAFMLYTFINIH